MALLSHFLGIASSFDHNDNIILNVMELVVPVNVLTVLKELHQFYMH